MNIVYLPNWGPLNIIKVKTENNTTLKLDWHIVLNLIILKVRIIVKFAIIVKELTNMQCYFYEYKCIMIIILFR